MKKAPPENTIEAAIYAAREEQKALILQAAALQSLPSATVIGRIAELEAKIFGLELYQETA